MKFGAKSSKMSARSLNEGSQRYALKQMLFEPVQRENTIRKSQIKLGIVCPAIDNGDTKICYEYKCIKGEVMFRFVLLSVTLLAVSSQAVAAVKWNNSSGSSTNSDSEVNISKILPSQVSSNYFCEKELESFVNDFVFQEEKSITDKRLNSSQDILKMRISLMILSILVYTTGQLSLYSSPETQLQLLV